LVTLIDPRLKTGRGKGGDPRPQSPGRRRTKKYTPKKARESNESLVNLRTGKRPCFKGEGGLILGTRKDIVAAKGGLRRWAAAFWSAGTSPDGLHQGGKTRAG